MPLHVFPEDLLSLADAAKRLPKNGKGKSVDIRTLRRWAGRGVRGVRLELQHVGGRVYVSPDALFEFIKQCSQAPAEISNPSPSVAAKRAAARLEAMQA